MAEKLVNAFKNNNVEEFDEAKKDFGGRLSLGNV